jgi:hypothetical protein
MTQKVVPFTSKTVLAPTRTFIPATTTKALSAEIFPALPKSFATAAQTQSISKPTNKQCQAIASLKQLYPNLTVPAALPYVAAAKPPMAKIVRPSANFVTQFEAEECSQPDEDSETEISAIYSLALAATMRKHAPASTLDWAALDEDSSDEDW